MMTLKWTLLEQERAEVEMALGGTEQTQNRERLSHLSALTWVLMKMQSV